MLLGPAFVIGLTYYEGENVLFLMGILGVLVLEDSGNCSPICRFNIAEMKVNAECFLWRKELT